MEPAAQRKNEPKIVCVPPQEPPEHGTTMDEGESGQRVVRQLAAQLLTASKSMSGLEANVCAYQDAQAVTQETIQGYQHTLHHLHTQLDHTHQQVRVRIRL